jgi:hypothetical protein
MNKHIDDTKYLKWEDGMYVMLDDLECDYERALVEDSLRGCAYFKANFFFTSFNSIQDSLGVYTNIGGCWEEEGDAVIKLTRAQALYIATGETTCTTS